MFNPKLVPVAVSGTHLVMELLATRLSSDPLAIIGIKMTRRNLKLFTNACSIAEFTCRYVYYQSLYIEM